MTGRWGSVAAVALVVAAAVATAQPAPASGDLYLPAALVVGPDETLRLGPGAIVRGPGHIEVLGRLEAVGEPGHPVEIRVPVQLGGNATAELSQTRVVGVPGAALTVRGGALTLRDSTFGRNLVGLLVEPAGNATVAASNLTFSGHAAAAVRVVGAANVTLAGSSWTDNAVGVEADLAHEAWQVVVSDGTFQGNGEHVAVDLGDASAPALAILERNVFAGEEGSVVVRGPDLPADAADRPRIALRDNRFEGALLGLLLRGDGYAVESRGDGFFGNRVAISAERAPLHLERTRFESLERDLDLSPGSRVTYDRVAFTPVSPPSGGLPLLPVGVGVVLALAAATAAWRSRRSRAVPIDAAAEAAPSDVMPPEDSRIGALSALELRILHDVAANPGTPQAAVAARLGLSRQALHYHVKKLASSGLLVKTPQGRVTECRVGPGVRLPPLPLAVTQPEAVEKE